ncbi:hypothetical protein uan_099 [Pseudomonas phage UAntarctica]|nr:hypothetical protein uan_099 [Pseudomonas phage UAntarctica]
MKVVAAAQTPERSWNPIDYVAMARHYNNAELNGGVELDRVYNITLFKRALEGWGIREGIDFTAANHKAITLVTRLSATRMTKE